METKAMLPTPAAQEKLALLLRSKLSVEARKCIFGSTYATIEELIEKLERVYSPAKSVHQLQGELGNTSMWERENVLYYAARIEEIADRIKDAHRLNNGGQVDNAFKQNLCKTSDAGPDTISTGPPPCYALDAHRALSSSSQL